MGKIHIFADSESKSKIIDIIKEPQASLDRLPSQEIKMELSHSFDPIEMPTRELILLDADRKLRKHVSSLHKLGKKEVTNIQKDIKNILSIIDEIQEREIGLKQVIALNREECDIQIEESTKVMHSKIQALENEIIKVEQLKPSITEIRHKTERVIEKFDKRLLIFNIVLIIINIILLIK